MPWRQERPAAESEDYPAAVDNACHVILHLLDPRLVSGLASQDVARTICQALRRYAQQAGGDEVETQGRLESARMYQGKPSDSVSVRGSGMRGWCSMWCCAQLSSRL